MLLGCHMSIAGGLHHALELARQFGYDTTALFVRNQRQWRVPPLDPDAVAAFRRTRQSLQISPVVAHGSYLLNLAGSDEIRRKSIDALAADLDRCDRLGVEYLVIHPGANADAKVGLAMIADGLNEVFQRHCGPSARAKVLLETTAGAGSIRGGTFEELAEIIAQIRTTNRVGVCLDTCHIFAAGYEIRKPADYRKTMEQFDKILGLDRLMAIHLNDSAKDFGSHIDRHAHIGAGKIGLAGIRNFVNDRRLAGVPMIMETPKGLRESDGKDWDEINGQVVRSLVR